MAHDEGITVLSSRAKFPDFQDNAKNIVLMVIVNPMKTQIEGCESLIPKGKLIFLFLKLHPCAITQNHKN